MNGDLPKGWKQATLSEVCDINPPKTRANALPADSSVTFVPMAAVDAERGEITQPGSRPFGRIRNGYTAFRDGDVIMAKITPCMENGKAAIARHLEHGLGFGSTEFHVLRPREVVLPEFIYHYIRQESFRRAAESHMTGSVGQKRVPAEFLYEAEIPLPPLHEQRQIVSMLEELQPQIRGVQQRLSRVRTILKRFRQAVLAAACSGRLTADWRSGHFSIRDAGDSELPPGWRWEAIEEVIPPGGIFDGPFGSNLKTADYTDSGIRVIRLENIGHLGFIPEKQAYISQEKYKTLTKHAVGTGDIIFASFVEAEIRVCLLPELPTTAIAKADCFCLRPLPEIDRGYLVLQLASPESYDRLVENIHGATRPRINITQLRKLEVRLCHLEEQREIVRRVEALFSLANQVENHCVQATAHAEKLAEAILARAFRGELVSTEADFVPATNKTAQVETDKD